MNKEQILVINCGSSSLKFSLMEPVSGHVSASGLAERLGSTNACVTVKLENSEKEMIELPDAGHGEALDAILGKLGDQSIVGVGHRIVHGGEYFTESVLVDESVIERIAEVSELAPLHNPAHVIGIRGAMQRFPHVPHVVVFDTAFHQTMPKRAYLYAVPYSLYENYKVRRYGFHGTSHRYVAGRAAEMLGRPLESLHLITAHLGNGSSACAVREGKSVDTTMGLTPLEGFAMGTRSGDVDPNLHEYLCRRTKCDLATVTAMYNRESGLLGLSGLSNDMRAVTQAAAMGNERAIMALDVFCYRLAKYILGMAIALDRVDALVFTGGIGENSTLVRARTLEQLKILRAELDPDLNAVHGTGANGRVSSSSSQLLAMVVPTNEELVIARETARFVPVAASL